MKTSGMLGLGGLYGREQSFQVQVGGIGERSGVIAAFERADEPAASVGAGDIEDDLGECLEVLGLQPERANRVERMGVKPGADENQLRLVVGGSFFDRSAEVADEIGPTDPISLGDVA